MNELKEITKDGIRVLTTNQLAESYGTNSDYINRNFNNNKDRYKLGKHYFLLEGEDLKQFKMTIGKNDGSLVRVNKLYLWTEKGAWLHAKSLNTDEAWDAYELLVDDYYQKQSNVIPLSKDQALITVLHTTAELLERYEGIEKEQSDLRRYVNQIDEKVEEQITLSSLEQRKMQKSIAARIYKLAEQSIQQQLGFNENDEIKPDVKQIRSKYFSELHREIKDRFGVSSYKDIRRKEFESAISYVENWIPRRVA